METPLMNELEKSLMFNGMINGSDTKRECEVTRCQNYIMLLEDRIKHLESLIETKDSIIKFQEGMKEGHY